MSNFYTQSIIQRLLYVYLRSLEDHWALILRLLYKGSYTFALDHQKITVHSKTIRENTKPC